MNAAETILGMLEERGIRPDRGFYSFLLRGLHALDQTERIFEVYFTLPEAYQGGDRAGVAILAQMIRGRLDRVTGLFDVMRQQDDMASNEVMIMILEKLLTNQDWKIALQAVELMIDYDVTITKSQRKWIESIVHANPKGPALEVMGGFSMLRVIGGMVSDGCDNANEASNALPKVDGSIF